VSIRLRITLFGLGVTTGVLLLVCVGIFVLLAAGVSNTQDRTLGERADQAAATLTAPGGGDGAPAAPVLGATDPRVSNDMFVIVLDRDGKLLASTGAVDGVVPALPAAMLDAAESAGRARGTIDAAPNVPIRVHVRTWTRAGTEQGYVAAAQTTRRVQQEQAGLFVVVLIYAVLGFCAAAGAIWLVTGSALRPLRQLTGLVDEIGRSQDLGRRLPPVATRDDVGRLTGSFNAMMARLQEAYRRLADALAAQQRFTADASHELRTPLTTIRNNAGFLLHHADAEAADREAAVRDIAGESERMTRLVESLLTLARADAGQRLTMAPLDLGELVENVCRQARTLHPDRQIQCSVVASPPIAGDADALSQLLWILIDNAVKHTAEDGNVWVAVTQRGTWAQVNVADDGRGIPPGDERRILGRYC
jgi:signal transduction histidine kinase